MPSVEAIRPPANTGASAPASSPSCARVCTWPPSRIAWRTTEDLNSGAMFSCSWLTRSSIALANSVERSLSRTAADSASESSKSLEDMPATSWTNDSSSLWLLRVTFFADQKYELSSTCMS
jgi:hypothetical protein